MNTAEHLLACLIEGCTDVQHAATKALRFGPEAGHPDGDTTNAQDIAYSLTKLSAVIDLCREHGIFIMPDQPQPIRNEARRRTLEFIEYAKSVGALE